MTKETPRTLAAFKAEHDRDTVIPNKIRAAIAAMLKVGPEHWEYECDFIKRAGVSQTDMSRYRSQFERYTVVAPQIAKSRSPRTVWFADPKVAARVRNDG